MTALTELDTREDNISGILAYFEVATGDWRPKPLKAKYNSCEAFVRAEGAILRAEPFTPGEEAFLLRVFAGAKSVYRTGQCYENATNLCWYAVTLAVIDEKNGKPAMKVEYGEGFANHGLLPTLHGVMLLNGKPVDLTYRLEMRKGNHTHQPNLLLERARYCLANIGYYMVAFSVAEMNRILLTKGTYGLIDNMEEKFPLLRNGR